MMRDADDECCLIVESNIPKTFDESKVFDYLLTYTYIIRISLLGNLKIQS